MRWVQPIHYIDINFHLNQILGNVLVILRRERMFRITIEGSIYYKIKLNKRKGQDFRTIKILKSTIETVGVFLWLIDERILRPD